MGNMVNNWLTWVKDLDAYCVILLLFHLVNICHNKELGRKEKQNKKFKVVWYCGSLPIYKKKEWNQIWSAILKCFTNYYIIFKCLETAWEEDTLKNIYWPYISITIYHCWLNIYKFHVITVIYIDSSVDTLNF